MVASYMHAWFWVIFCILIRAKLPITFWNTIWYHLHVESKIRHKWTYLQNRNRLTDIENRLVVAKGEAGGGRMNWECGISRGKLVYIGCINNKVLKVLLYSTGNYIQYPVINHHGKEYEKEYIYLYYNWVTAVQQKLTQYCKSAILQ